jgi:hypothetical protein
MQPQPNFLHPRFERGPHLLGLTLGHTMHHRIIRIAFEVNGREFPCEELVERIVHEEVGEHGRDRRSLRGNAA